MADVPTGAEMVRELRRLSEKLDLAENYLEAQSRRWAQAEDAYRLARARCQLSAHEMLDRSGRKARVDECEAFVDLQTSEERKEAHEAEALMLAARESIKSRRAQLSAWQSITAVVRAEAEIAGRGPIHPDVA